MRTLAIMVLSSCLLCGLGLQPAYANKFFHQATIDEMRQESIVIDDHEHKFGPAVRFFTANNQEIGRGAFAKGQKVNFEVNEKNELVSVWQYAPPRE